MRQGIETVFISTEVAGSQTVRELESCLEEDHCIFSLSSCLTIPYRGYWQRSASFLMQKVLANVFLLDKTSALFITPLNSLMPSSLEPHYFLTSAGMLHLSQRSKSCRIPCGAVLENGYKTTTVGFRNLLMAEERENSAVSSALLRGDWRRRRESLPTNVLSLLAKLTQSKAAVARKVLFGSRAGAYPLWIKLLQSYPQK